MDPSSRREPLSPAASDQGNLCLLQRRFKKPVFIWGFDIRVSRAPIEHTHRDPLSPGHVTRVETRFDVTMVFMVSWW